MEPEITIPESVAVQIRENMRRFIDSIFELDPETALPRKRPGAASIVAIMERSGAITGAGITAWFERYQITDPELIHLSYMGNELEQVCTFWNPDIPWWVEESDHLDAQQTLRELAASDHPFAHEVRRLSEAFSRLPDGLHEIRVIDDYVHDGVASEWILPAAIRVAAEQAGYLPDEIDIRLAALEDMIQYHFFDDDERVNDFSVAPPVPPEVSATRRRIIYDPYRLITMAQRGNWLNEVVMATFGPDLDRDVVGQFNLVMRGASDYDGTPAHAQVSAILPPRYDPRQKAIALLEAKGVPAAQVSDYVSSLRARLTEKILALTAISS
jgi:hypothetical protein